QGRFRFQCINVLGEGFADRVPLLGLTVNLQCSYPRNLRPSRSAVGHISHAIHRAPPLNSASTLAASARARSIVSVPMLDSARSRSFSMALCFELLELVTTAGWRRMS